MVRSCVSIALALIVVMLALGRELAIAQTHLGVVAGTVLDGNAKPVSQAQVDLVGASSGRTATGGDGAFKFANVIPGIYTLTVTKAGFATGSRDDVTVLADQTSAVPVTLQASTFTALREIGSVTTIGRNPINVSPASVSVVSAQTFRDQGQLLVSKILNQTPGVVATFAGAQQNGEMNGAAPGTYFATQVRGGLPYETASLIDGHPIAVAFIGTYNALGLDSRILQDLEVVKGPGATPANINYAVNGTLNYRTLDPTTKPHGLIEQSVDGYGGLASNIRATGTLPDGKFGYALDYAVNGTPGLLHNYMGTTAVIPLFASGNPINNGQINGQPICFAFQCSPSAIVPKPGTPFFNDYTINTRIIGTGLPINTDYIFHNELIKGRYRFSQQTSLTASYLGTQGNYNQEGSQAFTNSNVFFMPPAGYSGSIPVGTPITCCGQVFPSYVQVNQGIWQGEFHTSFANSSFSARYYAGTLGSITNGSCNGQCPVYNYNLNLTGGINLGTSATPTFFDNSPAVLSALYTSSVVNIYDRLGGVTLQYDVTQGDNVYTVAYDESADAAFARVSFNLALSRTAPPTWFTVAFVPKGSKQDFKTWSGRAVLAVNPKTTLTLSDYLLNYDDHYSSNGGKTFQDSTHTFNAPRLSLVYRPNPDLSLRAALGASIAPPFIRQISASAFPPTPDVFVGNAHYFTQTLGAGTLNPETAFGYNLGFDARFGGPAIRRSNPIIATFDAYLTNLQGQYLNATFLLNPAYVSTTFPQPGPLPLFGTQTQNLGNSRYTGLELGLKQAPNVGWGWLAQGAVLRAYAYNVPASLYLSVAGPVTKNLAILPNANFVGSSSTTGYNGTWTGVGQGRVPYAQGYGEINYRSVQGLYGNIGATYYGNNNSYNWPAFWTLSANLRVPLWQHASIQASGDNLGNVHATSLPCIDCGIAVPLANGQLGKSVGVNLGPPTVRFTLRQEI